MFLHISVFNISDSSVTINTEDNNGPNSDVQHQPRVERRARVMRQFYEPLNEEYDEEMDLETTAKRVMEVFEEER